MKKRIFATVLQLVVWLALIGCATSVVKEQAHVTKQEVPLTITTLIKGYNSIPDKFVGQWHEIEHIYKYKTSKQMKKIGNSEVSITTDQISWKQESSDPENFKAEIPYLVIENGNKIVFMIREIAYWNHETGEKGFRDAMIEVMLDGDLLMMVKIPGVAYVSGERYSVSGPQVIFRYKSKK